LYLSRDGILDSGDTLLGRVHHQGDVAGRSSYTETLTAALPALPEGRYHLLVLVDSRGMVPDTNRANNTGASGPTIALAVPALVPGTTIPGTIASGQDVYYRLEVASGQDVTVGADFTASPQAEFYVRYGAPPDRSNFDQVAHDLFAAHQQLLLANAQGGA